MTIKNQLLSYIATIVLMLFTSCSMNMSKLQIQTNFRLLDHARQATFLVDFPRTIGSATLIGRKRISKNQYKYSALTAYHILHEIIRDFTKDKTKVDRNIELMFQLKFHAEPLRIKTKISNIELVAPILDCAIFSFVINNKLPCAQLATKAEFEKITAFQNIYAVGYGDSYGQFSRVGAMGTTHNQHYRVEQQIKYNKMPWHKRPRDFFRPYVNIWYGDSGGAIYDQKGRLIGIINGFGTCYPDTYPYQRSLPVTHSTIALKAHLIRTLTKHNKDLFIIED